MITLTKAKMVANLQAPGAPLKNKIKFVTMLTQAVARDLGAPWLLFEKGGVIRAGFDTVGLDANFTGATLTHDVTVMKTSNKLKLEGVEVGHFQAHRLGDGKKKPKRLMLTFLVAYSGNPFELLEHMLKIGKADGDVTIQAPEQQNLPEMGTSTPDKDGRFPNTEPTASKKIGRGTIGHLYAVEAVGGWYWGAAGQTPKEIHQNPLRMANGPLESEQAALQAAAKDLTEFLEKLIKKLRGPEKEATVKLGEWAAAIGNPKA